MSPQVTVVVPTHNRAGRLPELVDALTSQEGDLDYEIVIVDDCSTDETWAVLEELAKNSSVPIVPLRTPRNLGPAAARNIAWRAGGGSILAFTDDDCVPQPRWLQSLIAGARDADVVQGRTVPPDDATWGPFARHMTIERWSDLYETCNMAYRREVLDRVGGFDETYRRPYGEDADLGWRAMESGVTTRFVADAVVHHPVEHTSLFDDFRSELKGHSRKVWTAKTLKRHPQLRRRFYRRWFYLPHHPRTIVALTATVAASRTRGRRRAFILLLGWLPYLHYRVKVQPRLARRRHMAPIVAMGAVSDAVEVGALAVGSARFRTLLL